MKKSYHSMVVPIALARATRRGSALIVPSTPAILADFGESSIMDMRRSTPRRICAAALSIYNLRQVTPSYIHGSSETPLLGETIGLCLDRIAAQYPENDALVSCHQRLRYTYRELHREVETVARGFMSLGVERGDRVGVWSPNCAEWLISQYALAKVGAIMVNVNPAYRLRELEHALSQSGISVVVAAPRFRNADYAAMLDDVKPRLSSLRQIVYLGEKSHGEAITWNDLLAGADKVPASQLREREESLQFDDPASIQYTSGTTGAPKGATLSHHSILNNG